MKFESDSKSDSELPIYQQWQKNFEKPFETFTGALKRTQSHSHLRQHIINDTIDEPKDQNENNNANDFPELEQLFTPRRSRSHSTLTTNRYRRFRTQLSLPHRRRNRQNNNHPYHDHTSSFPLHTQTNSIPTNQSQSQIKKPLKLGKKTTDDQKIKAEARVNRIPISPNLWTPDENSPAWMSAGGESFLPTAHRHRKIRYYELEHDPTTGITYKPREESASVLLKDVKDVIEKDRNSNRIPGIPSWVPFQNSNRHVNKDKSVTQRDLRVLDPKSTMTASVVIKDGALVVVLQPLRAIITHKKAYLFAPGTQYVRGAIKTIIQKVKNQTEDNYIDESDRQNFETIIFESLLIYATLYLEKQYANIEPSLLITLRALEYSETKSAKNLLEKLRSLEIQLKQHYSDTEDLYKTLNKVWEDEEKVNYLNLTALAEGSSWQNDKHFDDDENEMTYLLTQYLPWILSLTSKARNLKTSIEATLDYVEIRMRQAQNELLLIDLTITAFTTALSFCTAITAIFGMNFSFPKSLGELPRSQYWFYGCIVFLVVVSFFGLYFLRWWCVRRGLFKAGTRFDKINKNATLSGPAVSTAKRFDF